MGAGTVSALCLVCVCLRKFSLILNAIKCKSLAYTGAEISQRNIFLIHPKAGQPKDADVPNSVLYVSFLCA